MLCKQKTQVLLQKTCALLCLVRCRFQLHQTSARLPCLEKRLGPPDGTFACLGVVSLILQGLDLDTMLMPCWATLVNRGTVLLPLLGGGLLDGCSPLVGTSDKELNPQLG